MPSAGMMLTVVLLVVVLVVEIVVVVVGTFKVKNHNLTPAGTELPKMSMMPLSKAIMSTTALLELAALTPEAATLDQPEILMIKTRLSADHVIEETIGVPAV